MEIISRGVGRAAFKWLRGSMLMQSDAPGVWESLGYHNYGDPWRK